MKDFKKIIRPLLGLFILVLIFFSIVSLVTIFPSKGFAKRWEFKKIYTKALEEEKRGSLGKAIEYLEKIDDSFGKDKKIYNAWFKLALLYEKANRFLEAKKLLEKIILESGTGDIIKKAQEELGKLNIKIIFSPLVTENAFLYEVKEGDSLIKIAQRFNTTVELIRKANNLKEDAFLRPGMKLKITKEKFSVLVDKSQNTLTLKADDRVVKVYTVSTGLNNITPVGTFKIINKITKPVWYKDGKVISPDDPENILGSHWLGISERGYGIHGTTQPETIGKHVTQGCVRMYNHDVEELYIILPIGTEVTIME
ncbi:MAG: L,D-transpeptidase family protein [Candidatus Omnitrophica bacterium]|nr:L,D-transpeptidase family protein [Candidatus Omnitrophota bacterium]